MIEEKKKTQIEFWKIKKRKIQIKYQNVPGAPAGVADTAKQTPNNKKKIESLNLNL